MTSVGEIEIEAISGRDPATGHWVSVGREVLGLSAHDRMSPVLEERLCFTATRTGSYEAAAEVAGRWGSPVADDSTIHAHVR